MKTILALIIFNSSLITLQCSAQGVSKSILDSGYKVLRINKKYDEVKQYLVKIDKKDLWDTAKSRGIGGQFTSGWTVNLKKAGMETFFGLKVDRIEVYFNGELDKNDKPYDTDIFCFPIALEMLVVRVFFQALEHVPNPQPSYKVSQSDDVIASCKSHK